MIPRVLMTRLLTPVVWGARTSRMRVLRLTLAALVAEPRAGRGADYHASRRGLHDGCHRLRARGHEESGHQLAGHAPRLHAVRRGSLPPEPATGQAEPYRESRRVN
jgi:hypothetical protein